MSNPYYVIEIESPNGAIASYDIAGGSCIVGRSDKKADLVLEDRKASGAHAELRFAQGRVTVHDMGSTNGTHFEGQRMDRPFPLTPGEFFVIGDCRLRLVSIRGLEPPRAEPSASAPNYDEATRAMSLDDLPAEPGPGLEATRAMDLSAYQAGGGSGSGYPESSGGYADQPASYDDYGLPDLGEEADGRTVAFDRSKLRIGDFEKGRPAPPPARDDAPAPRARRGAVAWMGLLFLVPYAIALIVLTVLKPGGEVKGPSLEEGDPASAIMEAALTGWRVVNSEYMLLSLLGGEYYTTAEVHFGNAKRAYDDAVDATGADKAKALTELTESAAFLTGATGALASHMESVRMMLWITMGMAFVAGILLFLKFRIVAGILLLIGLGAPFAIYQPTPVEPLIFTSVVGLFGLMAIAAGIIARRRA